MSLTLLPTRNSLKETIRRSTVQQLNPLVADLTDLHSRIKQAHWNLRGEAFYPIHRLLDEFADSIRKHTDEVAERSTALGGIVEGTLSDAAAKSELGGIVEGTLSDAAAKSDLGGAEEPASKKATQRDWLTELADSYASCGERVLAAIKATDDQDDFVSADLLTDVLHDLDQQLWIIESHLNR